MKETIPIRRVASGDAHALMHFYNTLSVASKRTFRPLGPVTTLEVCQAIIVKNTAKEATQSDWVAVWDGGIVGWSFLWKLDTPEPLFGLAVADVYHGQGLGTGLMTRVMTVARELGLPKVYLTVVTDNLVAQNLYTRQGFVRYGEVVGADGLPYFQMVANLGSKAGV